MKSKLFLIIGTAVILLSGCTGKSSENVPPEIALGKDACDNCFMLINEKKFAASIRLENGEAKRFDDIGCMIQYLDKIKSEAAHRNLSLGGSIIEAYWVYDFISGKPLKAQNAFFVSTKNNSTPMGFGIEAFKNKEDAINSADQNKTDVMSFKKLKTNKLNSNME
jgi:copper chaperone NosL